MSVLVMMGVMPPKRKQFSSHHESDDTPDCYDPNIQPLENPMASTTEFHIDANGNPTIGSRWRHHSGRVYVILMITNAATTNPQKFPVTAVYLGESNGLYWSRPVDAFTGEQAKFTPEV